MTKIILNILFPFLPLFNYIKEMPLFCRHRMIYWDMKWYMEDPSAPKYDKFNGKIWKDHFCQCQKCGVKYRRNMRPGEWGNWIKSDFNPSKNSFIEVEIFTLGQESKRSRRDNILNELLK